MVEPLCMCATILHFGYEMLLNSPCFESLELFWETIETLGAGVLAERHRSPGISPWRLHPVSSAPPPARLMTPAFCLPWGDVPILPYNGLNTESCELKRRILPKLLLGIQSQGWEKQYSVNINAMYVWKVFSPNVCSALMTPPRGPRNTAGGDARTPSQENQHSSTVHRRTTASFAVRWSQTHSVTWMTWAFRR